MSGPILFRWNVLLGQTPGNRYRYRIRIPALADMAHETVLDVDRECPISAIFSLYMSLFFF